MFKSQILISVLYGKEALVESAVQSTTEASQVAKISNETQPGLQKQTPLLGEPTRNESDGGTGGSDHETAAYLLLLPAEDIETNPGPHCYACSNPVRHSTSPLCCSAQSLIKELPRALTTREPLPGQLDCPWASKGSWEVYPEGAAPSRLSQQTLVCS